MRTKKTVKTKNKNLPRFFGAFAAAGLLFFVLPTVSVFDVMPDIVGWILLYLAVSELAFFSAELAGLKRMTAFLCAISVVRFFISIAMADRIMSTALSDTNNFMTAVSFLSVCELICVIVYCRRFFGGLEFVTMRNAGSKSVKAVSDATFLGYAFFITRIVLTLLPELLVLAQTQAYTDIERSDYWEAMFNMRLPAQVLCGMISLALGIYFFVAMLNMFASLRQDGSFIEALEYRFENEDIRNSASVKAEKIRSGLFYITIGLLFFINFVLDFKYLTPTFAAAVLIYAGARAMNGVYDFRSLKRAALIALPILTAAYFFRLSTADGFWHEVSLFSSYVSMSLTQKILCGVFGALSCGACVYLIKCLYGSISKMTLQVTGKDASRLFILPRVMAYIYCAVNFAIYAFPPAREALVEADIIVTVAWLILTLRLFTKINDEAQSLITTS